MAKKENITRISIPSGTKRSASTTNKNDKSDDKQNSKKNLEKSPKLPKFSRKVSLPSIVKAPFVYFIGAWRELRQVRWPNRGTTFSLTFAVIVFSIIMALFILLLDLVFNELSKRILA